MIVITGGAGFIGSVLAWKLNALGRKDLLIVDQGAPKSAKWNNIQKRTFEAYMESDDFIRQLEAGRFGAKISAIFHMGACSDTTETDLVYLRENNFLYSQRLARWALEHKVYFAYASSAATYGAGERGYDDDDRLTPDLSPLNPYGKSKLDFDQWILTNRLQEKVIGFRFFNVYGPNEYHKGAMRSMVHKGHGQIVAEGKIRLFKSHKTGYNDGEQKRDFIYAKDVVDAMGWFFENPSKQGILNIGTGRAHSWNELAGALFTATGRPERIEYIPMPESIRAQYQYFTEARMDKFYRTGCPVKFRDISCGTADYVDNHLSKNDPFL